jgi:ABC-2 type transport system permease protein
VGDYQSVLIILMFGVPLFDFVVLTAVFSHPVIRGLGVAVVGEDRSDTSRAFIELVLKPSRDREDCRGTVMVANRTREMRLSGMTRGAHGNANYGQG